MPSATGLNVSCDAEDFIFHNIGMCEVAVMLLNELETNQIPP